MDLSKYRAVFLEEATENLGEFSRALLTLEKDPADVESIDLLFRMAHSIKGMAASLGYESIEQVSHQLEDRMQEIRSAGRLSGPEASAMLFRGLEGLEKMIQSVRETEESPPPDPELCAALAVPLESRQPEGGKKKS